MSAVASARLRSSSARPPRSARAPGGESDALRSAIRRRRFARSISATSRTSRSKALHAFTWPAVSLRSTLSEGSSRSSALNGSSGTAARGLSRYESRGDRLGLDERVLGAVQDEDRSLDRLRLALVGNDEPAVEGDDAVERLAAIGELQHRRAAEAEADRGEMLRVDALLLLQHLERRFRARREQPRLLRRFVVPGLSLLHVAGRLARAEHVRGESVVDHLRGLA